MPVYDYDIGIIGGGAAGLTVASGAAQLGARTILIEKEKALGGDCLHFGCVPSKTLIKTAHVCHLMKRSKEFGLPGVEPGPVDFRKVAARIRSVIDVIQRHDSEERFCKLGVDVKFGEAVFTDEHTVRLNGKPVSARNWVISTGSSPAVPPLRGLGEIPFITNREVFSLDELPGSMVILGAGPIAVEMAQAFTRLGTRVMVVQRGGGILSREDPDMARMVMDALMSEGVEFHLDSEVTGARVLGKGMEVTIRSGQEPVKLSADAVLVALGRRANVEGLGLEDIGVEFDARGIKADGRLRTRHKHIYAAGDVTGAFQFTHAAGYEGGIVISNAIFRLPRKTDYTLLPWCTYVDPELASIGMNEMRAKEAGLGYTVWSEEFKGNDRGLAEGEAVGRIKMLLGEDEKPIGVQIFGPRAGEVMGEWVAALNGGVKLTTIASAVHPYPTLSEINKRVVGAYLSPKIFSERMRKGLKLFFNLKGRACGTP
jgi:pyruvate/2-oxoglutarate dehydrogenase complex dihydrolipoamide dehydrogenase (E3) component